MDRLPVRGAAARELGLPLPPARMPRLRGGRPLKHWRYVGVYGPELMLCAGDALIGVARMRWWALAERGRPLLERTARLGSGGVEVGEHSLRVRSDGVEIELSIEPAGEPVEVVSPAARGYIWTEKLPCRARGTVAAGDRRHELDLDGLIDHSAGYHDRRTAWRWSAGVGRSEAGQRLAWNLVTGVHDAPRASERTLWVDGQAVELEPAAFAPDLSGVELAGGGSLRFDEWCAREDRSNLVLMRSFYRQPFGTFEGELGGVRVAAGYGVMEEHDVVW
jgi:hypothetical protein